MEKESGDQAALSELRKAGAELSRPRLTSHFFYFPSRGSAERLAASLRQKGYDVEVAPSPAGDESWRVLAVHQVTLTPEALSDLRNALERLASEFDGDYDGWEAAVEPKRG